MCKSILRQTLIFLSYLVVCSLFLFNHSGGADIAFMFFVVIFMALHLIVALVKVFRIKVPKDDSEWTSKDVMAILGLALLFIFFHNYYLQLMWWFTNLFN